MKTEIKSKLIGGISKYLANGNHPLRPAQKQVLKDVVTDLKAGHEYGYIKRPTGTGKTVMFGAEVAAANMPTLILTPRTNLINQIRDTFLNENLFDFKPEQIGTYHEQVNSSERRRALKAPILITTYASYNNLRISNRPLVILDEVHRARGEVARELIKELLGKVYVQGWTATDTFVTGQNIGHYLFHDAKPLHTTSIADAVKGGEISHYKNVIVETHLGKPVTISGNRDFTEKELEKIVKLAGRDEAAIRFFSEVRDKETGLYMRDMNSIWYCAGVAHAKRVAGKITDLFGKGFALAVSGNTPKDDLERILDMHREGDLPCIVNADLLIEGFDSPSTSLAMMLRPTRSPIIAEQTGGRVLRIDPNNKNKIAYIVTFIDEKMYDVVPFGVVAGNTGILPERLTLTEKRPQNVKKPDLENIHDISSMNVHMSHLSVLDFIKKREAYLKAQARELTEEQKNEIIDAHKTYDHNAREASRHLEYVSAPMIRKVWKKEGLKMSEKVRITEEQKNEIIYAHKKYGGNLNEASKNLPYSHSTIQYHWSKAELETKIGLPAREIKKIVAGYDKYKGNAREASRHIHYDPQTIIKYWRAAELEPRGIKVSPKEKKEIIRAHKTYGGNAREASKHFPYSNVTILNHWRDAGLFKKK